MVDLTKYPAKRQKIRHSEINGAEWRFKKKSD